MSRVLIGNLPPGTTIRNIDDFCSPYGRLLYVDVKNQGNATIACVEYENLRNALNLARARHGYNFNGYNVQLKLMDDSGPCEVRDDTRQQNQLPAWSNNQMQGQSSYNYGGNNLGGNNYDNDCGPPSLDNSLDFNEACRIVFDRFLQEGYNRQVAKEKTLDFVTNMQRGPNQSFNNLNSNYFGSDQDMMNSNSNFGNFNNGNQNWSGGNNYDNGDQQMFFNSNWGGNFNGPSDQQMPSAWGGRSGLNGGGMSYPKGGGNNSGRTARGGYRDDMPSSSRRNIGGNRKDIGTENAKMGLNAFQGIAIREEDYVKSLEARKDIIDRIKRSGIKSENDKKDLKYHEKIINDYQRYDRHYKKSEKIINEDDERNLDRYISAKVFTSNYNRPNLSKMTDKRRKMYVAHKAIVDAYEMSLPERNSRHRPKAGYEARKKELLKQSELLTKYNDSQHSKMYKSLSRSLMSVGVQWDEANKLALHPERVVQELIQLRNYPKNVNKSKPLANPAKLVRTDFTKGNHTDPIKYLRRKEGLLHVAKSRVHVDNHTEGFKKKIQLLTSEGVDVDEAKLLAVHPITQLVSLLKLKHVKKKITKAEKNAAAAVDTRANKLKAGYQTANGILRKHENCDLDKLTEKEKAIIRIQLRRLRAYYTNEGKETPTTRFDILLNEIDEE